MNKLVFTLPNPESTRKFGKHLGRTAQPGEIICLDGDLGAGKTTLTQSIAEGLEVPRDFYVSSPSFNIFHEYPGRIPLYHMDLYRLKNENDVVDMGLDEYLYALGLCVIEWSMRAEGIYPESSLSVNLTYTDETSRLAVCTFKKRFWFERLSAFKKSSL